MESDESTPICRSTKISPAMPRVRTRWQVQTPSTDFARSTITLSSTRALSSRTLELSLTISRPVKSDQAADEQGYDRIGQWIAHLDGDKSQYDTNGGINVASRVHGVGHQDAALQPLAQDILVGRDADIDDQGHAHDAKESSVISGTDGFCRRFTAARIS